MDSCRALGLFLAYLTVSIVEGRVATFSIEDNLELDKEPATLNKPTAKTIRTQYGDIYDCVDIYKQPAMDHPALKDHKIQMAPTFGRASIHSKISNKRLSTSTNSRIKLGLGEECPTGTVPIRRTTKKQLFRAKSSFKAQFPSHYLVNGAGTGLEFAGVATKTNGTKLYGGGGSVSIYNPRVDPGQVSASTISIEGGPREEFSTIRVGWMVNVDTYGDNHTRLYTIWGQAVDGIVHGCFNTLCPGFIIVSTEIPLDAVFWIMSIPKGEQSYLRLSVIQDRITGDWWFMINENKTALGYWPKRLFTHLDNGADILRWGGVVQSYKQISPPMGNGDHSCHFNLITTVSDVGSLTPSSISPNSDIIEFQPLESRCYKVGKIPSKDYYRFWFGGPGGDGKHCHWV